MTAAEAGAPPVADTGSSLALNLMKLRTFIALFAVLVFFSLAAPNFLSTANLILMSKHVALNAFLAIGMTFVIVTGGIDLSVGSIVGLCGMVAGGLILNGLDLGIGYTVWFNVPEVDPHHARARRRHRRDQRPPHHAAQRRALHRDARHALCRARRRAPPVGRAHLPQPGGQAGPRHHRLRAPRRRPACSACPCRSGSSSSSRSAPPMSPASRRSAATSSRSAATSGRRPCPASACRASRCSSTCSRASAPRSSASSSPPS